MPIQGLNFTILSGFEGHQSYQSTGSFTVYNPNDGVAFVATDRTATGLSWDYKVPSQSGGRFPGPINSYLSIFYLDQGGGGQPGQIVVYAQPEQINVPYFWSIGRAVQAQGSSMDIVQGPQPANPGAGISRLWSNGTGSLHILLPNGTDKVVLDSANFQSYVTNATLGGDLTGTIGNATVVLQNTHYIFALNTAGSGQTRVLGRANTNSTYLFTGTDGNLYIYSDYPGTQIALFSATPTGGLTLTAGVLKTSTVAYAASPGDLGVSRSGGSGVIYFGNGSQYLYFDGTGNWILAGGAAFSFSGRLAIGGAITGQYLHTGDGSNGIVYADNGSLYLRSVSGVIVIDSGGGGFGDLSVARNIVAGGTFRAGVNTGYMNQYVAPVVYSSTVYNAWVATPITLSFTVNAGSSAAVLVTYSVMVTSAVIGTIMYACPAVDGAISYYQVNHVFQANYYQIMSSAIMFTGLAAGTHTLTLYIQSNSGVWSIWNAGYNTLTVSGLMS